MTVTVCIVNAENATDKAERLFAQIHLKFPRALGLGEHLVSSPAEQKPLPPTPTKGRCIGQTNASSSKHRESQ